MTMACRYFIMAGGTGGHIFPAMAVARELIRRGAEVHWLGTLHGMEQSLVPSADIPLHTVTIKGFRGKRFFAKIIAPIHLLLAIWQSLSIMLRVKPQVVIGFGGYVAAPGGIAARLLCKPLIIHEQNSVAGSTNKLLSHLTSHVLEAFPGSLPKARHVGNPVRASIQLLHNKPNKISGTHRPKKQLLIMGGSLGAQAINQIAPLVLEQLSADSRPEVWHQTGKGKHAEVLAQYQQFGISARVEEFIDSVETAYEWADIIICRAGALTVSEIAVAGVPAIFIPYPYAIDNHQLTNAMWLADQKAAYVIEQKALTTERLKDYLQQLLLDEQHLLSMKKILKKLAIPDATDRVVAICEKIGLGETSHAA